MTKTREELEAIIADAQAQLDALPKQMTVLEEARGRVAVECKWEKVATGYRMGEFDTDFDMIAMVKIVQELRDANARIAELEALQS